MNSLKLWWKLLVMHDPNFRGLDLKGMDFTGAYLKNVSFRECNLSGACFKDADITRTLFIDCDLSRAIFVDAHVKAVTFCRCKFNGADLTRAKIVDAKISMVNFSGVKGLDIPSVLAELERTDNGFIAYKTFHEMYSPPEHWIIKKGSVITENVNPSIFETCGCGINVATLKWVRYRTEKLVWEVEIPFDAQIVVPLFTYGKFRVNRCRLIRSIPRRML